MTTIFFYHRQLITIQTQVIWFSQESFILCLTHTSIAICQKYLVIFKISMCVRVRLIIRPYYPNVSI